MPATAPLRAAIYARYSTDKQKETSVEDQFRLCRRHCDQKGWQVTQVFADHGISGTNSQRPDYLRLLQAAERGEVDIIVAESLNRLSRDQADTAPLFKRMSFFGDRLHTIADQDLDELKVGVGSLVSALYIKDIAQKNPPRLGGPCCLGQACRRQQPWISCKARDPRGWNGHHRAGSGTVEIAVGVGGTRRAPCPAAASQPVDPVPRAD